MEEEGLVIIAVDIEGRGPSAVRNGIVSIGLCVYIPSKRNWEKRHINILPYPGQTMDEKCKAEFWDKQGDLITVLQHQALLPSTAMQMFRDYIDQWPNVYLICDAPPMIFILSIITSIRKASSYFSLTGTVVLEQPMTGIPMQEVCAATGWTASGFPIRMLFSR